MALIECPECGKTVSDRAKACPNCGFPISELLGGSSVSNNQISATYEKSSTKNYKRTIGAPKKIDSQKKYVPILNIECEVPCLNILGYEVGFSSSEDNYVRYRRAYEILASTTSNHIRRLYDDYSLEEVIVKSCEMMNNCVPEFIDISIKSLYDSGTIISKENFLNKYYDFSFDYEDMIDQVVEKYAEIADEREKLERYRFLQKQSRSRFVGGGFGVKGAIKGAITAGVLNAGLDFVRSFGDSRIEQEDDRYINEKIDELKQSEFCKERIIDGAYACCMSIFYAMLKEMAEHGEYIDVYDNCYEEAENLFEATKQFENNEDKMVEAYIQVINIYPYNYYVYSELYDLAKKRNDYESIDSIYSICLYLGMKYFGYGMEESEDVVSNAIIASFVNNSEVLKDFNYEKNDINTYESVEKERKLIDVLLEDKTLIKPLNNHHIEKLNEYIQFKKPKVTSDYLSQPNIINSTKKMTLDKYVSYVFDVQEKWHIFNLPVNRFYVLGLRNSDFLQEKNIEGLKKSLVGNESYVLLYDSSYGFAKDGFALSQNYFYVFSRKEVIPLDSINSFSADMSNLSLVVECGKKIIIPYNFYDLIDDEETLKHRANDIVKILVVCLDHYKYFYRKVCENDNESEILERIQFFVNEIDKSNFNPKQKKKRINKILNKIGVLRNGNLFFSECEGEIYKKANSVYWNFVSRLTDEIDAEKSSLEYENEKKKYEFSEDIHEKCNVPHFILANIGMLKKASSKAAKELLEKNISKYEWLVEYNTTANGRFELKLIDGLLRYFPRLSQEFLCNDYGAYWGFYFSKESSFDISLRKDEHFIFIDIGTKKENEFIITNQRIFTRFRVIRGGGSNRYADKEGGLEYTNLDDIISVTGSNHSFIANSIQVNEKKESVLEPGLGGKELALCINDAIKAYKNPNTSFDFKELEKQLSVVLKNDIITDEECNVCSDDDRRSIQEIKKISCPNCGKEISEKSKFCIFCGKSTIIKRIVCVNCGKEISENAKFCNYCGTAIGNTNKTDALLTVKDEKYLSNAEKNGAVYLWGNIKQVELDDEKIMQIDSLINTDKKIEAIKVFRSATGLGLKESKEAIESYILNKERHSN